MAVLTTGQPQQAMNTKDEQFLSSLAHGSHTGT